MCLVPIQCDVTRRLLASCEGNHHGQEQEQGSEDLIRAKVPAEFGWPGLSSKHRGSGDRTTKSNPNEVTQVDNHPHYDDSDGILVVVSISAEEL